MSPKGQNLGIEEFHTVTRCFPSIVRRDIILVYSVTEVPRKAPQRIHHLRCVLKIYRNITKNKQTNKQKNKEGREYLK